MEAITITRRLNTAHRLARALPLFSLALLAAVGGCQTHHAPAPAPGERQGAILFSPNGEPLSGGPLGHPKCEVAIGGWFERTDANHDGAIDRAEFLTDAKNQFARMDQHQNGYLTSLDLSEFRAPYEPQVPQAASAEGDDRPQSGEAGRRHPRDHDKDHDDSGRTVSSRGAGVDTRADPVMSADKTLSFKVTLADFIDHAGEVFASLDAHHDGRLDRAEVLTLCDTTKDKQK